MNLAGSVFTGQAGRHGTGRDRTVDGDSVACWPQFAGHNLRGTGSHSLLNFTDTMGNSPFARFHLFRNPFGELSRSERAQLAVLDVQAAVRWLDKPKAAIHIVGPCGHGKTTHLLAIGSAWARRMREQSPDGDDVEVPYVYFPCDGSQPALPRQRLALIDECQRMNRKRLRQMLSGNGPLAISTHDDICDQLERAGFEVLNIDVSIPASTDVLREILNRRVLASRVIDGQVKASFNDEDMRAGYHPLCLSVDQVLALQQRFGSNIRTIEHYLYEAFQRFAEKGEPWLPAS